MRQGHGTTEGSVGIFLFHSAELIEKSVIFLAFVLSINK